MEFKNKKVMQIILNNLPIIGQGSQGICYYNKKDEVYKIFHQAFEDDDFINYTKNELLRFSNVKNKTFLWAKDVIVLENEIIGYITDYVKAKSLFKIDPLKMNDISEVEKDIKIISNNGIKTYDLMYNTLYGNSFYMTDFDEFSYSDLDSKILEDMNKRNFYYELYYFLIDGYFDEFIKQYKILNKMYEEKKDNILTFIELLRKYLSEYIGSNINSLNEAKKCLNKVKQINFVYQRDLSIGGIK